MAHIDPALEDDLPLEDEDDLFDPNAPDDEEDGEDDDPPEITLEQRARAMGWKPLAEYRGDPRRWTDAAEFIRKGEEELPVLRDQSRRIGRNNGP